MDFDNLILAIINIEPFLKDKKDAVKVLTSTNVSIQGLRLNKANMN